MLRCSPVVSERRHAEHLAFVLEGLDLMNAETAFSNSWDAGISSSSIWRRARTFPIDLTTLLGLVNCCRGVDPPFTTCSERQRRSTLIDSRSCRPVNSNTGLLVLLSFIFQRSSKNVFRCPLMNNVFADWQFYLSGDESSITSISRRGIWSRGGGEFDCC